MMGQSDRVRYFEVIATGVGTFGVLGDLSWTNKIRRIYADCHTLEAAKAACRLLSVGEGSESKTGRRG
jgi:hypothetical protein